MSETSDSNSPCRHPDHHALHLCQLTKKGLKDEIAARRTEPKFICHNCNATADRAEDLCNCSPLTPGER